MAKLTTKKNDPAKTTKTTPQKEVSNPKVSNKEISKEEVSKKAKKITADTFDAAYYERFYHNEHSQAVSEQEQQRLANFIQAYLTHLELSVQSILDIGCGIGSILNALSTAYPKATTVGVEYSPYLCETYGWHNSSADTYAGAGADLVVCSDVLGYLPNKQCSAAIENLAKLTHQVLYLAVLTEEDLATCDQSRTDMRQYLRRAAWYKKKLARHFVAIGGGLYIKKSLNHPLWQLETCDN